MEKEIFRFFKEENNDMLSKLDFYDLNTLIDLLDNYLISYRYRLNLPEKLTFGTEIEVANADIYQIKNQIDLNKNLNCYWNTEFETSIERGVEVNSSIMQDKKIFWEDLDVVCSIISELGLINLETSSHVHIGAHILGDNKKNWLNFIKLWATYENIIFRFTNGEYINTRLSAMEYASPIKDLLIKTNKKYKLESKSLYNLLCELSKERYQAVNFMNVNKKYICQKKDKNTIEFRTPNGTLDPIIIQNNINFFSKLLLYSKSSGYNDDIITKRNKINKNKNVDYTMNNKINLNKALELVDLLFDNNLDKINFLKQYLKSFEDSARINVKCKKLTNR